MKKSVINSVVIITALTTLFTCCKGKSELTDQQAADNVAKLIDDIYVQSRNENTDAQCIEAKKAWDALSDQQKLLVEGENASFDYFGLQTGDATKDNPLNQDEISENEILVVSFGTSFNDSRYEDIGSIEKEIQNANPDWSVRRAFTAQIIINHIQSRDGVCIDNMDQALSRAVKNGVKNLVIQPTHLMHGSEYDEIVDELSKYSDKFENLAIAEPLLGSLGKSANSVNNDKRIVAEAITNQAVKESKYSSLSEAEENKVAFVFMGHGTSHTAKISYTQMATQMKELSYNNVFIGTVEGEPEETECNNVIEAVKNAGYTKVILRPLMVVAGDHANNDMAGDEDDSWKSLFIASGYFEAVDCQIAGLGRIKLIQDLYKSHVSDAINTLSNVNLSNTLKTDNLSNGVYKVSFKTDSSMFRVNEANKGKGELTVNNGIMTIHISLSGKNIVNLYLGDAESAKNDETNWLYPTNDIVTFDDGSTEEVFGFDIPVAFLNKDFDLAILGTKGKWYNHKVSVENN